VSIPKAIMKQDLSGLIVDWGVTARIARFSGSANAAGKMSGTFVSVATQIMWIQPYAKRRNKGSVRDDFGLVDENYYECFWPFNGFEMMPNDEVAVPGLTYVYDTLSDDQPENYRHAWLKLTART
jgi:hypothetical protein